MKPTPKIWAAAFWLLLALGGHCAFAQVSPVTCIPQLSDVPTAFANWNWEYDLTQPQYCKAWNANLATGGVRFLRAPWVGAASDFIMRIGTTQDYRRANGWELVRMDFGGNQGVVQNPYFALYNRYTSVLRVFMYLANQAAYSKVLMTLQHTVGNSRSTAALAMANPLLLAPDKYLAQPGTSGDMMTYVCKYNGNGWIMGEYTMMFDPNVANQRFYESGLQFDVFGITTSSVVLGGSFQFTTKPQPEDGYGFSGPASMQTTTAAGTKSFLTSGTKFLGKIGGWSDDIEGLNKKAEKAATSLSAFNTPDKQPLYAAWKLSKYVGKQTSSNAAGALKGVFNAAGMLGGAFSLLGNVVGVLWPDAEQSTAPVQIAPTISSGTIKLTGTIETSVKLGGFSTQVPGTPHNFDPATNINGRTYQPYYDCPMGLFNLTATPRLERVLYKREFSEYFKPYFLEAASFRPMPIQFTYNRAAGIEVIAVKAAIMRKTPYGALQTQVNRMNLMQAQILVGALEVDPYDTGDPLTNDPNDDVFLVHTPFVDAKCFSQVGFNAFSREMASTQLFVRVIATMRRIGGPTNAAPIYFVQDYAAEVFASTLVFPPNSTGTPDPVDMEGPVPFGLYKGLIGPNYTDNIMNRFKLLVNGFCLA